MNNNHTMKKTLISTLPALLLLSASCDPNAAKKSTKPVGEQAAAAPMKSVAGVDSTLSGPREVMKAKTDGHEVIAVLTWREYDAAKDGSVTKWYGDMGTPPPKFVVESLMISVDGRGTMVPNSKTAYLGSQWANAAKRLGLVSQGKNLCVYVNVGDGAEAWTASYVVNPATGSLVSHQVQDGAEFHNKIQP